MKKEKLNQAKPMAINNLPDKVSDIVAAGIIALDKAKKIMAKKKLVSYRLNLGQTNTIVQCSPKISKEKAQRMLEKNYLENMKKW